MLLHQAAPGFQKWFGVLPKVSAELRGSDRCRHSGALTMIVLGLTGSIGMGKSTTAKMFEELGVPVHDSGRLGSSRSTLGRPRRWSRQPFPGRCAMAWSIARSSRSACLGNPAALKQLEAIVHPLVRAAADAFLERHRKAGAPLVVLDIPLLFETGGRARVDKVVVVTASPDIQRERVLSRPGMTEEKFAAILAKQVPDAEKRSAADYVIDTGQGMEPARAAVAAIVAELAGDKPAS